MVSQEMAAIPSRSVIENVYLGVRTKPVGTARANFGARYEQLCAETGIWLNPGARVFTLSQADRQQLEIRAPSPPGPGSCCWTSRRPL